MEGSSNAGDELREFMKQYNWTTFADLQLDSKTEYINDCCQYCDIILNKIKAGICEAMHLDLNSVVIEQEDWGWLLEFQKNDVFYNLGVSHQGKDVGKAHNFGVAVEAVLFKKGLLFKRKFEAEQELKEFTEKLENVAKSNQIEVFEE